MRKTLDEVTLGFTKNVPTEYQHSLVYFLAYLSDNNIEIIFEEKIGDKINI